MNLNIVFGVDDNFAKHCGATIASILSNHKIKEDKIKIFLLGDLNDDNKNKFIALKKIQDFEIEFIKVNEEDFKDLPVFKSCGSKTKSLANYYRLLITEILPSNIEKAIYLDCDVIVNKDISKLWDTNVDNYLAACVELDNGYFNSGVMILNLYTLRRFKFYARWRKYIKDNYFKIDYDQGVLNDVIGHNVLLLPTNWNLYYKNYKHFDYDKRKIDQYIAYNYIIHYIGPKPWNPLCPHPLRDFYAKYANMTNWKEDLEFSVLIKAKLFIKNFFIYWYVHPLFLLKIKFWKAVRKRGLLLEIY